MRFVIVTGMSGAGKITALKIFEDNGYYCVDNLPIDLIENFADLLFSQTSEKNKVAIGDKSTVGCLQYGRIWIKTASKANPAYKEKVYMITDGDEAGLFTTSDDESTKVEVNAIFLGETDTGIANAEFRPGAVIKAAATK